MSSESQHTRRAFLQGQAAARTLVDKAAQWAEKTAAALAGPELAGIVPGKTSALHLHASRRAMACDFEVQYHGGGEATEAMIAALDLVERLEAQMTIYRDDSELTTINRHAAREPVAIEPRLFGLLQLAQRLHRETGGALDITTGPLSRVWGFLQRKGQLPSNDQIATAQSLVGFDQVQLIPETKSIQFTTAGVEINLNAIGKGYALDRAAELLEGQGVSDFLWHGGRSSVLARGRNRIRDPREKTANDGWTIGLRHPFEPEKRLAEFHLHNSALATAGSATQFFKHDGKSFGHILNPRTGWPAANLLTATAIAPTAAEADALATAFYILGPSETRKYCDRHPEVKAVLISPARQHDGQNGKIGIDAFGMQVDDWTPVCTLAESLEPAQRLAR